jgi:hypothetical protein
MWVAIAAMAVKAVGEMQKAGDEARSMNTQADLMNQGAVNARRVASAREERVRYDSALKLGEQRAAAGQSGFDPNTGSTLRLQKESAGNAELDALTTRYEGELRAIDLGNQASSLKARAKTTRKSGYLGAAGTLLSAVSMGYGAAAGSKIAGYSSSGAGITGSGASVF